MFETILGVFIQVKKKLEFAKRDSCGFCVCVCPIFIPTPYLNSSSVNLTYDCMAVHMCQTTLKYLHFIVNKFTPQN